MAAMLAHHKIIAYGCNVGAPQNYPLWLQCWRTTKLSPMTAMLAHHKIIPYDCNVGTPQNYPL